MMQRMLNASTWLQPWRSSQTPDACSEKSLALKVANQQQLEELSALQQALTRLQERCDAQSAEIREQRHYSKMLERRCEQLELSCEAQQRKHNRDELFAKHQALVSKENTAGITDLGSDMEQGHLHMKFLAELAAKDADLQLMDAQLQHACQVAHACQQQLAIYEHWYNTVRQYISPDMRAEETLGALEQLLQGSMEEDRQQVPSVGYELGTRRRAAKSCSQPGAAPEAKWVEARHPVRSSCSDMGRITRPHGCAAKGRDADFQAQQRKEELHQQHHEGALQGRNQISPSASGNIQHTGEDARRPAPRSRLPLLPQVLRQPSLSLLAHPSVALAPNGKAQGSTASQKGVGCARPGRTLMTGRALPLSGLDSPFCPDSPCAVINSRGSSCGGKSNAISEWEGVESGEIYVGGQH